jgi:hypothetical protein
MVIPASLEILLKKCGPAIPFYIQHYGKNHDQMAMRNPTSSGAGTTAAMFASELEIR